MARRHLDVRRLTQAPGRFATRPRAVGIAAAALALVLVAGTVTFGLLALNGSAVQQARVDAVAAAEEAVPRLLSYDHTTLEAETPQRLELLTGSFKDDYAQLMRDVVLPAARQSSLITSTELVDSGVVTEDGPDTVTVLLFLNQSTGAQGQVPDVAGSRVRATLERPDDRWLVSELTPV
ncbi:hypothetical protein [Pseudonocardia pini]|uniref:hypothetical protein n=1 Tax=Pseudonocardia pini TaxID=2758030 RepID=UPI0015F0209D|nr:hypothetical protein [Pseudonocardia pini]